MDHPIIKEGLQCNKCDAILVSTLLSDGFAIFTWIDQGLVTIIFEEVNKDNHVYGFHRFCDPPYLICITFH